MQRLEIHSGTPHFLYVMWLSQTTREWVLHEMQILHSGSAILPPHKVSGKFVSKVDMIERGTQWCEAFVRKLLNQNIPVSDLLPRMQILLHQLPPDDFK